MEIHKLRDNILKCQLIVLVGIFIVLEGFLIYNLVDLIDYKQPLPAAVPEMTESDSAARRKIDGQEVGAGKENLYPVAVTIDNHFDGWPTFGLSRASVVYEALVEGQFTRFLAFYTPQKEANEVSKIGPVRSTRPYFLPLVKEYDALFAHSGGSPESLKKIQEMGIYNLEEIAWWGPDYFWRVYSRDAPHNLFSSSDKLAQGVIDWELADVIPNYQAWKFESEIKGDNYEAASEISIDFGRGELYRVDYKYATTTTDYARFQNNEAYIDGLSNQQTKVKNIVIQFVESETVIDAVGRLRLNLIGSGQAMLFRDGLKIDAKWKKLSDEARTIFYNKGGEEIKFAPGSIWIEIVPLGHEVTTHP